MSSLNPKNATTIAYTDGACKNNPGPGGWGVFLIFADGRTDELYGGNGETTNNQMEMMATIQAIINSPSDHMLEIWTDSSYVKNGITQWINGWKRNGWKTASKKEVKNKELWQQLDELNNQRDISWNWIKGHAGHEGNEKADELANKGVLDPMGNVNNAQTNVNDVLSKKNSQSKQSLIGSNADNNKDNMDWLFFDPLGLDCDEEFESDELDTVTNSDTFSNNIQDQISADAKPLAVLDNGLQSNIREQASVNSNQDNNQQLVNLANHSVSHNENYNGNLANMNTNNEPLNPDFPEFDGDTSRANPNFRPLLPQPIHKGNPHRQLIMDTETTGLDPNNGDRVIEVGIVEMINRKFTGEKLHVYTNPKRGMDDEVIRVHGITEAFLKDMPTFDKVAKQVYEFMDGAEIIAHNASFDMNFLNMEFAKVGLDDFNSRVTVTDSLVIAKQKYPGQKNTLDALVRRLNVGKQDRTFHGALLDSEILAEVYLAMTGGQVALAIDDEKNDDGNTTHKDFAKIASMLCAAEVLNTEDHNNWLNKLSEKNPAITDVWDM